MGSECISMFVIFDLDGTLADIEHRRHHVERSNKSQNWRAFFEECVDDEPQNHIIQLCHALISSGHQVEIWSGRSDQVRVQTEKWLDVHGLSKVHLKMRSKGDNTPDDVLKQTWLHASNRKPDLIFDDRNKVVEMWRRNGIPCCQVAPGDF